MEEEEVQLRNKNADVCARRCPQTHTHTLGL